MSFSVDWLFFLAFSISIVFAVLPFLVFLLLYVCERAVTWLPRVGWDIIVDDGEIVCFNGSVDDNAETPARSAADVAVVYRILALFLIWFALLI